MARHRLDQAAAEVTRQEQAVTAAVSAGETAARVDELRLLLRQRLEVLSMAAQVARSTEAEFVRLVRAEGEAAMVSAGAATVAA